MANTILSLKLLHANDEVESGESFPFGKALRLKVDGTSDDNAGGQIYRIAVRIRYKVRGIPHSKVLTFTTNATLNANFSSNIQRFRPAQPGVHAFTLVGWHVGTQPAFANLFKTKRVRIKVRA